ncbi:hypothetical protein [Gymnodinialimonas hymeniacidonis]|uniref:hypothetical protein n=1 Tax=Gymnodinialimonas hymeniacidonis TaxID=3126508 RepID=UPI0034C634FA
MPLLLNLTLVLVLIASAGVGGYLLARAHFTATIANRVLAYQARLARANRDTKQAHKDIDRLTAEADVLKADLERSRESLERYETALFEAQPAAAAPTTMVAPAPVEVAPSPEMPLEQQAEAYIQHVGGYDDFERSSGMEEAEPVAVDPHPHTLSRAIA